MVVFYIFWHISVGVTNIVAENFFPVGYKKMTLHVKAKVTTQNQNSHLKVT